MTPQPAQSAARITPAHRQRSAYFVALLSRCPEHLFSIDDKSLKPIL